MNSIDFYKNYFNGFQDALNYKTNDTQTNVVAALKVLSYFTVVIPLGFAALYQTASLYGSVSQKEPLSQQDKSINHQAKLTLITETPDLNSQTDLLQSPIAELPEASNANNLTAENKVNNVNKEEKSILKNQTAEINYLTDLLKLPNVSLPEVLNTYRSAFRPHINRLNLREYSNSEAYKRHAKTARIYYNSQQLTESDALRIIFQREPTNIAMGDNQYNEEQLQKLFGYKKGVYNDLSAKKSDKSSFKNLPNTATVYSETYLWDPPGEQNKKEIACLSLPAPALDSSDQPHYEYYMKTGKLNAERYEQEINFLFRTIKKVIMDNKDLAFAGKGIKRVVLSRFGQGAFLGALSAKDRVVAHNIYQQQMINFLNNLKDTEIEIVTSKFSNPDHVIGDEKVIIGDIIETAREGDLIINAWDPHSAPGNGNDEDYSFDGTMGKGSGILLTQTSWLNETLRSKDSLVAVE